MVLAADVDTKIATLISPLSLNMVLNDTMELSWIIQKIYLHHLKTQVNQEPIWKSEFQIEGSKTNFAFQFTYCERYGVWIVRYIEN